MTASIWNHEKVLAAAIIVISWIFRSVSSSQLLHCNHHIEMSEKNTDILCTSARLISFSTPLSFSTHTSSHLTSHTTYDALANEEDEIGLLLCHRVPLRTPMALNHCRGTSGNVSISSFADFVRAPGPMPYIGHSQASFIKTIRQCLFLNCLPVRAGQNH